jgi:hypothetical protein
MATVRAAIRDGLRAIENGLPAFKGRHDLADIQDKQAVCIVVAYLAGTGQGYSFDPRKRRPPVHSTVREALEQVYARSGDPRHAHSQGPDRA